MKLHNNAPYMMPRLATQAYGEQERRFERIQPIAPDAGQQQGTQAQQTSQARSFAFSLGGLGVRYEEQEPQVDTQQLARLALERVRREQDASFRAEMEVEELRNAILAPNTDQEAEPLALPSAEPGAHVKNMARKAYAEHERAHRMSHFRPGVFIGVV